MREAIESVQDRAAEPSRTVELVVRANDIIKAEDIECRFAHFCEKCRKRYYYPLNPQCFCGLPINVWVEATVNIKIKNSDKQRPYKMEETMRDIV